MPRNNNVIDQRAKLGPDGKPILDNNGRVVLDPFKCQGKFWFGTDFDIEKNYDVQPASFWTSKEIIFAKGQLEQCPTTQRQHWQLVVAFQTKIFGRPALTRTGFSEIQYCVSEEANNYVWKDETSLGRRFEFGRTPHKRNSKIDFEKVKKRAKSGDLDHDDIPASVFVQFYGSLTKIKKDYAAPTGIEKEVNVYVGDTGLGKSRRAWEEAGFDAYPKAPTTKFWDGYRDHEHVVIDEYFGQIEISHLLRWLDRYPVLVETKGSSVCLKAKKIWITSNLHPSEWYPTLPQVQQDALMRRLNVVVFTEEWIPASQNQLGVLGDLIVQEATGNSLNSE